MSKLEELKQRISYLKGFLAILSGTVVLACSGLVNLYLKNELTEVFWLGIAFVFAILVAGLKIMSRIEDYLQELGRL